MIIHELPENLACFVCECVFTNKRKPLVVKYDVEGDVQCLCGMANHIAPDPKVISLSEIRKKMSAYTDEINGLNPGEFLRIDRLGRCIVTKNAS